MYKYDYKYEVMNNFNGNTTIFEDLNKARNYIDLCIEKKIPFNVNYYYTLCKENDTVTQ